MKENFNPSTLFVELRAIELMLQGMCYAYTEPIYKARKEIIARSGLADGIYVLAGSSLYKKGDGRKLGWGGWSISSFFAPFGNDNLRSHRIASKQMMFKVQDGDWDSLGPQTMLLCIATWDKAGDEFWEGRNFPNGSNYQICKLEGILPALGGEVRVVKAKGSIHFSTESDTVVYRDYNFGTPKEEDWIKVS